MTGAVRPAAICTLLSVLLMGAPRPAAVEVHEPDVETARPSGPTEELSLDRCLAMALEHNRRRATSQAEVTAAEARLRQARSGSWPQVSLTAGFQRFDESLNFLFPPSMQYIPPQTVTVPGGTANVTIPANAFGPGFPPSDISLPVSYPSQTIETPASTFAVPAQDVKLMDPSVTTASLDGKWLLFDGGMRRGLRGQAQGGVDVAKQEARRSDLEIADSVKRVYYGAVLARRLHDIGEETLARMEATLSLTETMYKEGSGRVKKTDYLDNKVMVETIRAAVAALEKNEAMARAGLANAIGLAWNVDVAPADREIPFEDFQPSVDDLVGAAFEFSPDWSKVEAGIRALESAETTARSGRFPKIALTGELHRFWNDYEYGIASDANKTGWSVGVGLELPVFDGHLTTAKVAEARARLDKVRQERLLLQDGIGLQVRDLVMELGSVRKQYDATLEAKTSATENRELNTRAYQNELVETQDLIRAQLVEALMSAQHEKTRYDLVAARSRLDLLVGTEVSKRVGDAR